MNVARVRMSFLADLVFQLERSHPTTVADMLVCAVPMFPISPDGVVRSAKSGQISWEPRLQPQLTDAFSHHSFAFPGAASCAITSTDIYNSLSEPFCAELPRAILAFVASEPGERLPRLRGPKEARMIEAVAESDRCCHHRGRSGPRLPPVHKDGTFPCDPIGGGHFESARGNHGGEWSTCSAVWPQQFVHRRLSLHVLSFHFGKRWVFCSGPRKPSLSTSSPGEVGAATRQMLSPPCGLAMRNPGRPCWPGATRGSSHLCGPQSRCHFRGC